jgi:leader peptidase (prepilin peptidase)/N-methyltransferase
MSDGLGVVLLIGLALIIGSFLNVCIYRIPRGMSIVSPPSHCTSCGRRLKWRDNVPLIGYLFIGGRCRQCGARVSPMYPLIEAITPAVFLLQYWQLGWQPLLIPRLIFACAMIVLCVIDLQHRILPNVITLPGIVVGFLFSVFLPPGWRSALIGLAMGGGVLFAIAKAYYRVRGEEGLGMGDVKMLAMIGAFLGWQLMLVTLLLATFTGSIVGLVMIALGRGNLKYALPLGTFLAWSAIVSTVIGAPLVNWYIRFY